MLRMVALAGLASALPCSVMLAQDLSFIQMPLDASPRDLLHNPISNKLYAANTPQPGAPSADSVTIINSETNAIITILSMATGPRDFCLNTQSNEVYVANYFADSVTVIDGVTDSILAVIPVGDGPRALCFNPQDNRIYCANEFSNNVTVIDGASRSVVASVGVGSTPRVICYNQIANKVYCPNAGSHSVSVISGSTNALIATVPVGTIPRGIVFNPQNNAVYCSNYGSDTVSVIDGVSNAVIATVSVGDGPTALGHNPVGNKVYVSNVGAPGPGTPSACSVSVISGVSHAVIKTLVAGDEPTAFSYSGNDGNMYWVNEWSHSLAVVDAATDTQTGLLSLGTGQVQPVDIAYNSLRGTIYTANRMTYTIGVVTTATRATPFCSGDGTLTVACPCGNNGNVGRGCANSQPGSPGAQLSSTGSALVDTLSLQASDMLPTATAIFLQGNLSSAGLTFGDGVRCTGGTLRRLAVKTSEGGSAMFPYAGSGDSSIRARSTALGDPITFGNVRSYQTYYRDPNPGFCPAPAGNTFNITNGLIVQW
jgi:YVTN family beta-propeller protein